MVSHILLTLVSVGTTGPSATQDIEALKSYATKVLRLAYSSTVEPPKELFGPEGPEIKQTAESISFVFWGGRVTFRPGSPNPNYFACYGQAPPLAHPLTPEQLRKRATEFVRAFSPRTPFLMEPWQGGGSMKLHPMEHGIPHTMHYWLTIDATTGIVTNGAFPGVPPEIKRIPASSVGKDRAIAEGIQRALAKNPELDIFRINKAIAFWVVPTVESWSNASSVAREAANEKKAIKAYVVDFYGEKISEGSKSRKVGGMWVDAETGRVLAGSMSKPDGLGGSSSVLSGMRTPTAIFIKDTWKPVTTKESAALSTDPQGEVVLAMKGDEVVRARYDNKARILWLPDKEAWRSLSVVE